MKTTKCLTRFSYALICSTPLLLTACDSMPGLFGESSSSNPNYNYDYNKPAPNVSTEANTTVHAQKTNKSVKVVEPGISTVTTPTTKPTTNTAVDGPSVPSMAPTVGQ